MRAIRSELASARKIARATGWPELQGTKKQIKWAEIIRVKILQQADADADILKSKSSATYWIENREKSAAQLIEEVDSSTEAK